MRNMKAARAAHGDYLKKLQRIKELQEEVGRLRALADECGTVTETIEIYEDIMAIEKRIESTEKERDSIARVIVRFVFGEEGEQ